MCGGLAVSVWVSASAVVTRSCALRRLTVDDEMDNVAVDLDLPGLAVNSVRAFMNTCSRSLFTIPVQI